MSLPIFVEKLINIKEIDLAAFVFNGLIEWIPQKGLKASLIDLLEEIDPEIVEKLTHITEADIADDLIAEEIQNESHLLVYKIEHTHQSLGEAKVISLLKSENVILNDVDFQMDKQLIKTVDSHVELNPLVYSKITDHPDTQQSIISNVPAPKAAIVAPLVSLKLPDVLKMDLAPIKSSVIATLPADQSDCIKMDAAPKQPAIVNPFEQQPVLVDISGAEKQAAIPQEVYVWFQCLPYPMPNFEQVNQPLPMPQVQPPAPPPVPQPALAAQVVPKVVPAAEPVKVVVPPPAVPVEIPNIAQILMQRVVQSPAVVKAVSPSQTDSASDDEWAQEEKLDNAKRENNGIIGEVARGKLASFDIEPLVKEVVQDKDNQINAVVELFAKNFHQSIEVEKLAAQDQQNPALLQEIEAAVKAFENNIMIHLNQYGKKDIAIQIKDLLAGGIAAKMDVNKRLDIVKKEDVAKIADELLSSLEFMERVKVQFSQDVDHALAEEVKFLNGEVPVRKEMLANQIIADADIALKLGKEGIIKVYHDQHIDISALPADFQVQEVKHHIPQAIWENANKLAQAQHGNVIDESFIKREPVKVGHLKDKFGEQMKVIGDFMGEKAAPLVAINQVMHADDDKALENIRKVMKTPDSQPIDAKDVIVDPISQEIHGLGGVVASPASAMSQGSSSMDSHDAQALANILQALQSTEQHTFG